MNLLDAMVENSFKKSDDGKDLFYPSGVLGKGRIIPNELEKKKICKILKALYLSGFILIVANSIFKAYLILISAAILTCVIYHFVMSKTIKGFEISEGRLSSKEAIKKASKNYGKGFFIFGLIMGIIFIILGLGALLFINDGLNIFVPIWFLIIGLFFLIMYWRFLYYSREQKRS